MNKKTKTYEAPHLERYGSLGELTAGGSGPEVEGSMTGGGTGMGAGPLSRRP